MRATLHDVVEQVGAAAVAAIGITNQRETVVAWDRATGQPYGRAIVWQDRRTAARCDELAAAGALDLVRERTGLVLDPYFSGTKFEWLLGEGGVPVADDLALGTIDAWLIWNLTGGEVLRHRRHQRQPHDAVRHRPAALGRGARATCCTCRSTACPAVVPSSGRVGVTSDRCGAPRRDPDQRHRRRPAGGAVRPGLLRARAWPRTRTARAASCCSTSAPTCPPPAEGMLTTVAWTLADGTVAYALEGAIFSTGSAIQWLRDGLGHHRRGRRDRPAGGQRSTTAAASSSCPAFTGLGSPWWDPYARGTIVGITRGTTRAHLARAVVESMAFQTRDAVEAMVRASGRALTELRVDGGASVMDGLLQFQADQLGVPVQRPTERETTAIGAAYLAALAEGVVPDLDAVAAQWQLDASFAPAADRAAADAAHATWLRAVERSRAWAA